MRHHNKFVTRYNNYKTICTGLGYQNVPCDAGNGGKSIFIFYIPKKSPLHGEILPIQRNTLSIQSIIQYILKYYDLHLKRMAVSRNSRGVGKGGTKVRCGVCMGPLKAPRRYRTGPRRGCKGAERPRSPEVLTIWKQFVSLKYVISNLIF